MPLLLGAFDHSSDAVAALTAQLQIQIQMQMQMQMQIADTRYMYLTYWRAPKHMHSRLCIKLAFCLHARGRWWSRGSGGSYLVNLCIFLLKGKRN